MAHQLNIMRYNLYHLRVLTFYRPSKQRWLFGGISHSTKKNPHFLKIFAKSPGFLPNQKKNLQIFKKSPIPGIKIPRF